MAAAWGHLCCDGRALAHTSASSALRGAGMTAEGWEIYNGMSLRLCRRGPKLLCGPFGRGRCPARAAAPGPAVPTRRCCPARCPAAKAPGGMTGGDSSLLRAASHHTAPPPLIPAWSAHWGGKIPFGTQLPALSSACPLFHPKPCGAIDPGRVIFAHQGCITWLRADMGHGDAPSCAGSASQLRVHPRASLLPLSCPPPFISLFPKPRLHLPYYPPPRAIWVTLPCHYPR